MCCEHRKNDYDYENEMEMEDMVVDSGGALRTVLMSFGDSLIDLVNDLEVGELKITVSQNYNTGETEFKARADGNKVLEIKVDNYEE